MYIPNCRRLVERVEVMKRCRLGNGETECVLCGEVFRFYTRGQRRCAECAKMTCSKCGLESAVKPGTAGKDGGSEGGGDGDAGCVRPTFATLTNLIGQNICKTTGR